MSIINNVLKSISKNSDGFEEIDLFWNATERLAYPIKASFFSNKSVTTPAKSTPQKVDSDVEFNYDTSSTISDDQEDEEEDEESGSEDDKDEYDDVPSPEPMSVKTNKSQSILTSGVKSSRSSIQSSVYSPLNESLGTIGLSPLGTTATNNSTRQSLESSIDGSDVSGRDSLLSRGTPSTVAGSTRNSIAPPSSGKKSDINSSTTSRRSESGLDLSAGGEPNDSSFFADRSEDMNETGVQSEFGFGQRPPTSNGKGRRSSANRDSLDSLATPGSAVKPTNVTNLTSATKGARSMDRSGLRVSFSGKPELDGLSPIEGSAHGSVDTGASKRSKSRNSSLNESLDLSPNESTISANTSKNTTKNTSKNTTLNSSHNTSRNTTATSVRSSTTSPADSEPQQSRVTQNDDDGSFGDDNVDEYGEYEDREDLEQEEQPEEDDEMEASMSRIQSQTDTPTTNRSFSRSGMGVNDSSMRTPYSEANSSATSATGSSRRGGSMSMISTPGSNEFVRGYRIPDDLDASGMSGINDLSTDEEDLDETDAFTPERKGKKGRGKKHTVTDGEDDELNTTAEVSKSFIDPSLIYTISSANKKYVQGREILKKHKPKPKPVGSRRSRSSKLYHSSDEEEEQRLSEDDSEQEDGIQRRRSKRATKGQRFAYWKGERPIYEDGTMVGLITVDPTPQKRKRVVKVTEDGKSKRARKERADASDQEDEPRILPAVRLPRNVDYKSREECDALEIWDEVLETEREEKVFCSAESLLPPIALPRTAKRQPGRDKVGFAAHSFNVPEVPGKMSGWLSGFIDLPPDAIKDAEGVGRFTQVFFVSDCQDGALELGLADPTKNEWVDRSAQRVLLKKGDCFYVPPGNIYRLENHSTVKSSKLNWVIIKPLEQEVGEEEMDGEEVEDGSVISNDSVGDSPDTTGALLDGRGAGRRVPISVEEDM